MAKRDPLLDQPPAQHTGVVAAMQVDPAYAPKSYMDPLVGHVAPVSGKTGNPMAGAPGVPAPVVAPPHTSFDPIQPTVAAGPAEIPNIAYGAAPPDSAFRAPGAGRPTTPPFFGGAFPSPAPVIAPTNLQAHLAAGQAMFGEHAPDISAGLATAATRIRDGLARIPGGVPAAAQGPIADALSRLETAGVQVPGSSAVGGHPIRDLLGNVGRGHRRTFGVRPSPSPAPGPQTIYPPRRG